MPAPHPRHPSEERLQLILEASATGSFEVDLKTGAGRWNDSEYELLGLTPGAVVPGPESFFDYVHPEDVPFLGRAWENAKETGRFDVEFRVVRADGRVRWLAGKGGFIHIPAEGGPRGEEAEEPTHFLGINYDITDRKQAEEALRRSEAIYRAIGESIDYGVWVCDSAGQNIYASKAFLELVGLTQQEAKGFGWTCVLHPEERKDLLAAWRSCVDERGVWDVEMNVRGVDGAWHPVLSRGVTVTDEDGSVSNWVGINLDISQLKTAEEVARSKEIRLQLALDAAHLATWDWDLRDDALAWNREHFRMLGYAPDSFVPTYRHWAERVHPEDLARTEATIRQAVDRAEDYRAEFRLKLPDGTVREVEAIGRFEQDSKGEAVRLYGAMSDVTERKRILADLHQANAELERRVSERTLELVQANERLQVEMAERKQAENERLQLERQLLHTQKLESLGVLAGGIAHDFNNILSVIIGNTDMALLKLHDREAVAGNLERIRAASNRAADLAKQMLAYSGKGSIQLESLDVNQLLRESVRMLEHSVSKKATLRLDLTSDLPAVKADAGQIHQIVMNLVINASEAIGDEVGEILLRTEVCSIAGGAAEPLFSGGTAEEGRYVSLSVEDTGCGMDDDVRERIFDPFFTTKFTGRGLGMAVVLGIVKGHKGAIRVRSTPGKGSSFQVLLPADHTGKQPAAAEHSRPGWTRRGKVLLIDDEEAVRATGAEMLRELGFTALTADNGLAGIDMFAQHPDIELVILDLTMPVMGGEQCFDALRRANREIRILMISGYSTEEVIERLGDKQPVGFLTKPFSFSGLQKAIQEIMEGPGGAQGG